MDANFKFHMDDNPFNTEGGFDVKDATFSELSAFASTTMFAVMHELQYFARKEALDKEAATALVLKCVELAVGRYGKEVGKDAMQKAYELNAAVKDSRGVTMYTGTLTLCAAIAVLGVLAIGLDVLLNSFVFGDIEDEEGTDYERE